MKTKKLIVINVLIALSLTLLVSFVSLTLKGIELLPDQGPKWYYWKLPNPTWMTRLSAWALYLAHQIALWIVIIKMSKDKKPVTSNLTIYNKWLIGINLVFIGLHYIQTMVWYDGLAQDVSVGSSQYSVIIMLVLILIIENRRRGLFFGKKIKLPKEGVSNVIKFHGFYIAWAITYTFWFHPMEGSAGHLFGFFYMFLLFIQLSLSGTTYHFNKWWTLLLEVTVLFHGTTVAILQGSGIWSMFFFGFATMFVVTQIYGLGLSKKSIRIISILYVIMALVTYSGFIFDKSFGMIHQVLWIPIILYALVFVIVYLAQVPSLVIGSRK